jgi:hypothetical protein
MNKWLLVAKTGGETVREWFDRLGDAKEFAARLESDGYEVSVSERRYYGFEAV